MHITLALPHFINKSHVLTESGCQNLFKTTLLYSNKQKKMEG